MQPVEVDMIDIHSTQAVLECGVDEGGGPALGGASDLTTVHRAERDSADLFTGAAQSGVLHENFPPE